MTRAELTPEESEPRAGPSRESDKGAKSDESVINPSDTLEDSSVPGGLPGPDSRLPGFPALKSPSSLASRLPAVTGVSLTVSSDTVRVSGTRCAGGVSPWYRVQQSVQGGVPRVVYRQYRQGRVVHPGTPPGHPAQSTPPAPSLVYPAQSVTPAPAGHPFHCWSDIPLVTPVSLLVNPGRRHRRRARPGLRQT